VVKKVRKYASPSPRISSQSRQQHAQEAGKLKTSLIRTTLFVLFGSVPAILSAQAVPAVGSESADTWTPWEAAVSVNWTRADFPVLSDSLNTVNGTSSGFGAISPDLLVLTPQMSTNSLINTMGSDFALQQNFKGWLGFQFEASGGLDARSVKTGNVIEYKFEPKYLAFTYGPVVTLRTTHHINLWARGQIGIGREDACPDSNLKAAVRAINQKYLFADTGVAAQFGAGIDRSITPRLSLRLAVDDIHTALFNSAQDQLRAALGFAWRWGGGISD
jgi:hypothetical protein